MIVSWVQIKTTNALHVSIISGAPVNWRIIKKEKIIRKKKGQLVLLLSFGNRYSNSLDPMNSRGSLVLFCIVLCCTGVSSEKMGGLLREHILQDCMEFAGKRATLISLSRDIFLPTILGTEEGIKALSTFLKDTDIQSARNEDQKKWSGDSETGDKIPF